MTEFNDVLDHGYVRLVYEGEALYSRGFWDSGVYCEECETEACESDEEGDEGGGYLCYGQEV